MKSGLWFVVFLIAVVSGSVSAQTPKASTKPTTPEDVEFFEKRVRPLLVENCVSCHSGAQPLGGLRFDPIVDVLVGGKKGTVVVAGDPENSRMIRAIRQLPGIASMPPSGKLTDAQIETLTEWVRRGVPLPKTKSVLPTAKTVGFPLAQRRQHWAYQPIRQVAVPAVHNKAAVRNPIDAFLQAKREEKGLSVAPPTDKRTLLRRVTYDLIGLPPTPAEVNAFLADTSPLAYEKVVDRLLASPQYGERWGRHWLDLVRYAESLGHEFDFSIFNAYQYRDYVIRSFNADVPYDQFVREHLAGDLLAHPRRDPVSGRNESILGTGFFWLGEGKHSPVDVRQEQADRIDNQIDVMGKTFLAQTIACARCHNHKFDPIPTRDYYALYGILASSRYQQALADSPATYEPAIQSIKQVKNSIDRKALAQTWQENLKTVSDTKLQSILSASNPSALAKSTIAPVSTWQATGPAFGTPGSRGDIVLNPDSPPALLSQPTAHSALLSRRLEGALRSPTFTLNSDYLHLRVAGNNGRLLLIVDNFIMVRDPLYGELNQMVTHPTFSWHTMNVQRWKGHRAYIELVDSPVPSPSATGSADLPPEASVPNSGWLAITDALASDMAKPPLPENKAVPSREDLNAVLNHWATNELTERDTDSLSVLNELLQAGLLDATGLKATTQQLAKIEDTLPIPTRALAMCDGTGLNENVFIRGSHLTLGETAPRMQLAVCFTETKPAKTTGSGRLELANLIASPTHPLTARVMVNRIWKHHFGVGIVPTTDDFGHMGQMPTHPELLDWLTGEFIRQGWSIKKMHRLIVESNAYRMSSHASDSVVEHRDPKNIYLHRMPIRRLEAEAVRDGLLAVSGRLDKTMYGLGIYPALLEPEARGFPPQGPLDGKGRRTIYLAVRRNFLPSFLLAFDFPTPFSTIGRRTVSNVPAQALTLMNSELVWQQAAFWAKRLLTEMPTAPPERRITSLYETAFGRPPSSLELNAVAQFVNGRNGGDDIAMWTDVCHALYNAKEFIYVF